MKSSKNISLKAGAARFLSIGLMIFCLSFLTALNYFLYPSDRQSCEIGVAQAGSEDSDNPFPPSGPTEEKATGSGFSIAEEILHETHPELNFEASNYFYLHHIAEAEKMEIFHPELIVPPPKI